MGVLKANSDNAHWLWITTTGGVVTYYFSGFMWPSLSCQWAISGAVFRANDGARQAFRRSGPIVKVHAICKHPLCKIKKRAKFEKGLQKRWREGRKVAGVTSAPTISRSRIVHTTIIVNTRVYSGTPSIIASLSAEPASASIPVQLLSATPSSAASWVLIFCPLSEIVCAWATINDQLRPRLA